MKHKKYPKFEDYDFSDCREITGDELYRINGGGRIQPEQNENPPEGDSSNNSDSYTVQSGDTLSQIVYDYNQANGTHLTVDEVAALSGIDNPDVIFPGQSIVFSNPEQGGEPGQGSDPTAQGGQIPQSPGEYSTPNVESLSSAGSSVPTGQVPNSGVNGNVPFGNGVSAEFNPLENSTSNIQNNSLNETNTNHKANKQKGNKLLDKITGTLSRFILPNGINVDMNPENKRQNKFQQQPEVKNIYKQNSFDKPLHLGTIGKREAIGLGYSYSVGGVLNLNNPWDSGIILSFGIGTGFEYGFNLTSKPKVNKTIEILASSKKFTKPTSTKDIEGYSLNAYSVAGVGVSCDVYEGKATDLQVGSVGGGVYYEGTTVITAGEIGEFICNTPRFIMNEICNYSGMNKFLKFDYIDLDGH